jgi:nitrite reductase/ring-hydroxylating ferredoxin subunit
MPIRAFGDDFILVRSPNGKVAFMDGHCTHRGASLGHGAKFLGENVQCPFHGFEYGIDGRCVNIPNCARIPKSAVLKTYPVAESLGMIWLFWGSEPTFPPPSLENCGVIDEVGKLGTMSVAYGFRNTRRCLMRDSICGSLDYNHGNLVHGLKANLLSIDEPSPHEIVATSKVRYEDSGYLYHRKIFGLGDVVHYRGHYWGPAIVYTRSWGKKQLLGHIRMCLPVDFNITQTDILFVVKLRAGGRMPLLDIAIRKFFARYQDDEDTFLDHQKPRAMYLKESDQGMLAHHRLCMRMGQNAFEGREPTVESEESK